MPQVPSVRTLLSPVDYARAVISAWRHLGYPLAPTKEQVGVLYAQWMIETGGKACWNWNVGNTKVSQSQVDAGVDWHDLPGTWEIIQGQRLVLPAGDPGRRFRAFESLSDGMAHHLAFLRGKRYASAWPHVVAGDCTAFAHELKRMGYYTASAEDYAAGMRAHFRRWLSLDAYEVALAEWLADADAPTLRELPDSLDLASVVGVQRALSQLGYDVGPIDGVSGPRTKAAIVAYQRDVGLAADGIVGPKTRAALTEALDRCSHCGRAECDGACQPAA